VTGLVRASYAAYSAESERPSDVDSGAIESAPRPARSVPVVRPLSRDDPSAEPLTSAVDTYVGEPTAPDVPYRTSSFNRLLAQFDGEPDGLAKAAMLALGGMSSQAPAPPPRATESEQDSVEPVAIIPPVGSRQIPPSQQQQAPGRQQVLRRPSLAQSRRLGLAGHPGKPPEQDSSRHPDRTEPADAVAAPPSPEAPQARRLGIGAPVIREQTVDRPAPDPRDHERARQPSPTQPTEDEASSWPVVYRAAPLDPLPPPPVKDEPMQPEPVPVEMAAEFRARFDIDVTEVPIYRGPAVTALANAASAQAFTQRGEVYLPDEAGELTKPDSRALLAHELVHVAQQRVLGPNLPGESSPDGALLEAAAAGTQRWMRDGGASPPTLIPPPLQHRIASHQPADPSPAGTPAAFVHQPPPLPIPSPARISETHMQRAAVEEPAQHFDLDTLLSSAQTDGPQAPTSITAVSTEAGPVYLTAPRPAAAPSDPSSATSDIDALRGRIEQLSSTVDELATARSATPEAPGVTDRGDVDELARRLYPRIRDNLRRELIIDRERAGRLSDLR
jgi:hypothetical protein